MESDSSSDDEEGFWEEVEVAPPPATAAAPATTAASGSTQQHADGSISFDLDRSDSAAAAASPSARTSKAQERMLQQLGRAAWQRKVWLYEELHKCHLLCLISHHRHVNRCCNCRLLQGLVLSMLPKSVALMTEPSTTTVRLVITWVHRLFGRRVEGPSCGTTPPATTTTKDVVMLDSGSESDGDSDVMVVGHTGDDGREALSCHLERQLFAAVRRERAVKWEWLPLLLVLACRALGLEARLVVALDPLKARPKRPQKHRGKGKGRAATSSASPAKQQSGNKRRASSPKVRRESKRRRTEPARAVDVWAEVRIEERWTHVDQGHQALDTPSAAETLTTADLSYVLAFEASGRTVDITQTYTSAWGTARLRKRRLQDARWWARALRNPALRDEPVEEDVVVLDEEGNAGEAAAAPPPPLPSTLSAYKNHDFYVLKRDLKKAEALDPDAATVGFCKGEPVYRRSAVWALRSAEVWLREARVVPEGTIPLSYGKWNRVRGGGVVEMPVYAHHQTNAFEPPVAKNGKVPRNQYGYVDLFKRSMLPKGTVHMDLPDLGKVAKKLEIDFAEAVVGFTFVKGSMVPQKHGVVVCTEYRELLQQSWDQFRSTAHQVLSQKRESATLRRWMLLTRKLLIRARVDHDYFAK